MRFSKLLYLLTKLGFIFMRRYVPDLLAGCAYRPDIECADEIREVCSVACSVLAAQQGGTKTSGQMKQLLDQAADRADDMEHILFS